jgi:predicted AAA+ superfamily ATPase
MQDRKRILKAPSRSFFLLGPRGTGKTMWTKQVFPKAIRFDLLDPETYRALAAAPERLIERVKTLGPSVPIVIDEVQKLPTLLEVVHHLINDGIKNQFVLTGSSARKLRRGAVNLLGGRAVQRSMFPYLAIELGDAFNLEEHLSSGMLPVVVESHQRADVVKAYNALYIREEVLAEGLTRNAEAFARFLESIAFSHGNVLNISNVARDCQVKRKTVESYIEVLEDLMIAYRVPVFATQAKRLLSVHPKFYFFDVAVYRANLHTGPLTDHVGAEGAALEGLVAQHLRAWCEYSGDGRKLYYWRTRAQVEVDFIIYGPTTFEAIEVKNSKRIRPDDLRGLKAFAEDYPQCTCTLLYRGDEELQRDNIRIVPVDSWLRSLGRELLTDS